jgi:hypothetical protein
VSLLLFQKGEIGCALPLHEECLAKRKKVLGDDHPSASAFLGDEHPSTLASLNSVAHSCSKLASSLHSVTLLLLNISEG